MPRLIKVYIFIIISLLCCSCASDDLLQWKTLKANLKQAKVQQTKLQEGNNYTYNLELDYEYYLNSKKYTSKKFIYLSTDYWKDSAFDYSLQEIENSNSLFIEYSQLFPHISRFEPKWIKTKAKFILSPEQPTINIISDKQFKVINYPQVYYEYFINNQTFRKELKLVQNIYKEDRLRRLKDEAKPFRFSWIYNFDEKIQKKLSAGLTSEIAKEQIAEEYTNELFIKELNELLETNFKIKDYKQSINIYIDQKNLNLSFFDKPSFGKLADLAEIQKENRRLTKGIFNHLGLMLILCLPTFLCWGIIFGIRYLINRFKNKNLTKLAKSLEKKQILSDTETWRQEIFENTLKQIDEFILKNEEVIYSLEQKRNIWFWYFIIIFSILSILILGYSIHLCWLDAYSGISQSTLFGWKVILPLISLGFLGSILLSFSVSHLLRTLALVFVVALLIWTAISNYFFFGMALVLMMVFVKLNLKITKGFIQKYSLEFKQTIIKSLLAYKFKEFYYKPFEYISKSAIEHSGLFHIDNGYSGDDLVLGKCNNINFRFSEIHIYQEGGSKGYFDGLFIQLELPKANNSIFGTNPNFGNKILLDHPEFNSFFNIYGENTSEVFYILSSEVLDKLVELQINLGKLDISFSIVYNQVYFAIHTKQNLLEAPLFTSLWNREIYFEYFKVLNFIDDLTYSFK